MYAIIETGGKQVRVSEGDKICIEKICANMNDEILFDKVLALSKGDKLTLGKPYINGASVKAEVVGLSKSDKILVLRPRPKKAYRRLKGHRQQYSVLKIKEIIYSN